MKRMRTTGMTAIAGLMLAAGAAAAQSAGAADATSGDADHTSRGDVIYSARYLGKVDGLRGNVHDVSFDTQGQRSNYIHSYFCPRGADMDGMVGCTIRSNYQMLLDKSPVAFRVSATGKSATITGEVKSSLFGHTYIRTLDMDLALYATYDHDGDGGIYRADGTVAGNNHDTTPRGSLIRP